MTKTIYYKKTSHTKLLGVSMLFVFAFVALAAPLNVSALSGSASVQASSKNGNNETYNGALPSSPTSPSCYVGTPQGDQSTGCPKSNQLSSGKCYSIEQRGTNYKVDEVDCSSQATIDSSQSFNVPVSSGVAPVNDVQISANKPDGKDCSAPSNADEPSCTLTKQIIIPIVNILSLAVGILVVISIIIAGIQYITSNGNPQQVATAKSRIFNSIIALVVYIFGFALLQWLIPGGVFH